MRKKLKKTKKTVEVLYVYIDLDIAKWLKKQAKLEGRSMTSTIGKILTEYKNKFTPY